MEREACRGLILVVLFKKIITIKTSHSLYVTLLCNHTVYIENVLSSLLEELIAFACSLIIFIYNIYSIFVLLTLKFVNLSEKFIDVTINRFNTYYCITARWKDDDVGLVLANRVINRQPKPGGNQFDEDGWM